MSKRTIDRRTGLFEAAITTALFAAIVITASATWSLAAAWPG